MTTQTAPTQQWIKARDNRTGRLVAVLVPSASRPNVYHVVTSQSCNCKGFQHRRDCSHLKAVQAEIQARRSASCAGCNGGTYHRVGCERRPRVRVPLVARLAV